MRHGADGLSGLDRGEERAFLSFIDQKLFRVGNRVEIPEGIEQGLIVHVVLPSSAERGMGVSGLVAFAGPLS